MEFTHNSPVKMAALASGIASGSKDLVLLSEIYSFGLYGGGPPSARTLARMSQLQKQQLQQQLQQQRALQQRQMQLRQQQKQQQQKQQQQQHQQIQQQLLDLPTLINTYDYESDYGK